MSDTELKTAFEGVQKVGTEMRSTFDENMQKRDILLEERQSRIDADFVALRTQMDELAKSAKREAAKAEIVEGLTVEQRQHGTEYLHYLRRGTEPGDETVLTRATQATLGSDAEGGYVASPAVQAAVDRLLKVVSPVRSVARVVQIGSGSYKIPIDKLGANSGWVGETETRSKTNTPDLGQVEIPAHEVYANAFATQSLLDDAFLNVEAWLAESIAEEFDAAEGTAYVTGDGVKKPRGFMSYPTAIQTGLTEPAFGTVGFVKSGSATGFAPSTATTGDAFADVVRALKSGYRAGSAFAMNRLTEANVAKIKDADGQPLWRMSLRDGLPAQLVGYGIVIMDDMPDIADGAFPIAFGNWQRAYTIVDRFGIRTLRDPFSAKPFIQLYCTKRTGGGLVRSEALKLIQTAA